MAAITERVAARLAGHAARFRNAAVWAKQLATIDHIAGGGRVIAGIGAGWFEAEYLGYGAPFPPIGERLTRPRRDVRGAQAAAGAASR